LNYEQKTWTSLFRRSAAALMANLGFAKCNGSANSCYLRTMIDTRNIC